MISLAKHLEVKAEKHLFDLAAIIQTATKEQRALTADEEQQYAALEQELSSVTGQIAKFKADEGFRAALHELTGGPGAPSGLVVSRMGGVKTFGQRFVESDAFGWLKETKASRSGQWSSPSVEIARAALTRFALTEDPASGGGLVVPGYQPQIVSGPVQPIVVADLIAPGTTGSNVVPVMVETSFTNAAAAVLEGGTKPESALTFTLQNEPVRKLAHWLPVSEELLEDAPSVASYIDTRLRYGLLRVEDAQLLAGDGTAPNLSGILDRSGLAADVARVDPATNADAILEQIVAIEAATGLAVSGIVMNPAAWGAIIGLKLEDGSYLAGGPFGTATAPMLWGRQVALTDQITSTTALVGAFKTAAQIFRHGGIRVNSTNAHADFFVRNMVAIRAEERLALAVYRPQAFGEVTGLTTTP